MVDSLEAVVSEINSIDRHLSRRGFLGYAVLAGVVSPLRLDPDLRDFLRGMAESVVPKDALRQSGIDVVANIEHLLDRGSAGHRAKVLRLLAWARRISFLYGGPNLPVRGRGSRFVLVQKMSKALSALCLVAFWGDERALVLIDIPERTR